MAQARPADRTPRRARAAGAGGGSIDRRTISAGREIDDLAVLFHAEEAIGNERHVRKPRAPVARKRPSKMRGKSARRARSGTRSTQKLRIQFLSNAAVSHCRRIARADAGRDSRRSPRRTVHRRRRDRARSSPPPGRLRPRPPHGDRVRSRRHRLRRARRRNARRAGRDADRESRLDQLAVHDALDRRVRRAGRRDAGGARRAPVTRPRPGHADLAGGAKYERDDLRDILERASARETAARVAAGALARQLLAHAGIRISSHVFTLGSITVPDRERIDFAQASALPDDAPLRCVDQDARAGDDRGDRSRPRGGRHARRRVRGDRDRRPGRPRQLRAVGSQARWTAGAGADVDPRDQGRRHRPRARGRVAAGLARPRRDRRPATRRAPPASRGRPTTPAGSRAASPTARTSGSRST